MNPSERLREAMKKQVMGLWIDDSFINEIEVTEKMNSRSKLAMEKIYYECQDFNDPPFCGDECDFWALRFALNVKNIDIWGPSEADESVEKSYEKAKKTLNITL